MKFGETVIALRKNPFLPPAWFWQPSGVCRSLADAAAELDLNHKTVTQSVRSPATHPHPLLVAEIPGGKVIGDTLVVATSDDIAIGGLQSLHSDDPPESHWLLKRKRFRTTRRIAGRALMLSANGANYFHWLFESLPRLHLAELAGWSLQDFDWIILGSEVQAFQTETLLKLGVRLPQILRCSKSKVLQFDSLVVPSMPVAVSGMIESWPVEYLRQKLGGTVARTHSRFTYLSRKNFSRRRMVNETQLEARLIEMGFEVVMPENLGFFEQAKLFGEAAIIVSAHGAALANLVFSGRPSHLIEVFHPLIKRPIYKDLASLCGVSYQSVTGEVARSATSRIDDEAEFLVAIEEVAALVSRCRADASKK